MDGPAQWGAHRKSGRNADCHVLSSCLRDDDSTDNVALKQQRREHLISGRTKCDTRSECLCPCVFYLDGLGPRHLGQR